VADQNRAHAAPSGRFSDNDVNNAIFTLFEDEHSKQRAVLTHHPCPVSLTLFLHPIHEPGKVSGSADVRLQADLWSGRAQEADQPISIVLRSKSRHLFVGHETIAAPIYPKATGVVALGRAVVTNDDAALRANGSRPGGRPNSLSKGEYA
jgi:hypothetical protein